MQSTDLSLESNGEGIDQTARDRSQAEADGDRFFMLGADMFCTVDFDGCFRRINPAFERILGYLPDELLHKPFIDFVYVDDREATIAEAAKLSQGIKTVAFENRYYCKDGSYRWLSWTSTPYQEERLIYAIARDITEHRQATQELQASKQLLQLVFDLLPQRVFWKDQHFRYLGCNKLFAQDAQLESPEHIIGKDDFELAWKESAPLYRADDTNVIQNNLSRINYEESQIRADGTQIWLRTSKTPLRDERGEIIGIFGTYEDITDYKQAQIALAESEAKFRRLVEDASDYIFAFSKEGLFTYISPQFTQLFGYDPVDFLGKPFAPLVHPDDLAVCGAAYERLINTGKNEAGLEFRHHCQDGSWCWVSCNLSPIKNPEGEVVGYQGVMEDISDRKEAEAALQKEQEFLKTILDNLADGIVACDETGRLTIFNRATREFHGLPEASLPPEDWAPYFNLYQADGKTPMQTQDIPLFRAFQGEIVHRSEMVIAPKQGKTRVLLASGQAFFDQDGSKLGAVVAMHDITAQREREQAEAQLQEQEQFLRSIYDGVNCSIFVINVFENGEFRYDSYNNASEQLTGYRSADIAGKTPEELLGETTGALVREFLTRCVENRSPLLAEEYLTFSGDPIWMLTTYNPLFDHTDQVHRIVGTSFNITDLKQAEAQLQEQEQFLRSIYDGVSCSIFVVDVLENGEYRYASHNHAEAKLMGRLSADVEGKTPADLFGATEGAVICQFFDQCVAQKSTLTTEENLTFDGKATWLMTTFNPLFTQDGRVHRIVGTSFNITDLKQAEAQLQQQAADLEHALEELQRTQTQMVQSEKMSSLGQLVAGVAHEINNPVNFIYGNLNHANEYTQDLLRLLSLYEEHYPNPVDAIKAEAEAIDLDFLMTDLPKLLGSLKVGADRIQKIVASLRSFSRLDEAEVKDVDVHEGIDSTLMILHNRLKSRSEYPAIQVVKEYGELPPIECYAGQLNQVFMNILSNAIDALDEQNQVRSPAEVNEQPSVITIQTRVVGSDRVLIQIADNGPGIPEAVQKRLFDPFFTTKAVGKGTGMGMSISHQVITERHKGRLTCHSIPGQGATFVIEIPMRQTA
ncbi:MAG: PAS domain S-box protein [Leptolyngbya sp. BL-A-14]